MSRASLYKAPHDPNKCYLCGHIGEPTKRDQGFRNGNVHIRLECARCGGFIKWQKQGNKSFRDQIFSLVKEIAVCTTNEQFALIQSKARHLIKEAQGRGTVYAPLQDQEEFEL